MSTTPRVKVRRPLSKTLWEANRRRVWLSKRVHETWKLFKGYAIFNSDNDFAAHLLAMELKRQRRMIRKGMEMVQIENNADKPSAFATGSTKRTLFPSSTPNPKKSVPPDPADAYTSDNEEEEDINVTSSWLSGDDSRLNYSQVQFDNDRCQVLDGSVVIAHDDTFQSDPESDESDQDLYLEEHSSYVSDQDGEYRLKNALSILDDDCSGSSDEESSTTGSCRSGSDGDYSSLEDDDLMLSQIREVGQPEPPETSAPLPVPSHLLTTVTPPQLAGPPDPPTTVALRPPPQLSTAMPLLASPQMTAQETRPILMPAATAVAPLPVTVQALQQSRTNDTTVPEKRFMRTNECKKLEKELKLIRAQKVIVTENKITQLFSHCQGVGCDGTTMLKTRIVGTTLEIWWACNKGHKGKWTSSEEYQGMYANNLLMSSAILLSGNNFAKVELLSKFMGLGCPSSSSFHRVQRFYAIPAIEEWWSWMRDNIISMIGQLEVVLAGDGQNDSPGHSAKYLTYYVIVAEELENFIVQVECVDKREVDRKSPNMEKLALQRAIKSIKQVFKLKEMVTDASSSIIKMMREEFQEIVHSLDIWHKAKNMRKCITQVAKLRGNNKIGAWTDHIINHFWYCCENCGRSEEKLKTMWITLLHHICNEHEWLDGKCTHHQTENHSLLWFDRRDKDYEALQDVVLSPRLLNTLKFYVNFRHTGSLEAANSMSLMYAPKRCAFGMQAFKARKMLAAIDHNYHLNRKSLVHEKGEVQVTRKYISRTKRWDVEVIKEDKDYAYIPQMLAMIFERRKNDPGTMNDYMEMALDDPRRICSTIAAVPPPPSRELYAAHQSRFCTKK